jgi:hypothetical protein
MPTILFINPLKSGKLNEAKAFIAEFTGPRKLEYIDMLHRYGLKNTKIYYHAIAAQEFAIVTHEIENDDMEKLANWPSSTHPFDVWFKEQGARINDLTYAGQPITLLDFDPTKD